MRYLVIVPGSDQSEGGQLPPQDLVDRMQKFNEDMQAAGVMLWADGLYPTTHGVKIRFDDDRKVVTDGPFAETKEVIAGFWLIETRTKEEAVEWIKRAPFGGGVEIILRQIHDNADFEAAMKEKAAQQA